MAQIQLPPVPVNTPFADNKAQSGIDWSWLRWFQLLATEIAQLATDVVQLGVTPGPYANDAAAKTAGVAIGQRYYLSTGAVVVRLT